MSILTVTASRKTAAQAKEKRDAWALALVLVVMCLIGLVLAIISEPFAQAVELMGLS